MSIQDLRQKINTFIDPTQAVWIMSIFGVAFLLVGLIGLSLHVQQQEGIAITHFEAPLFDRDISIATSTAETVYASKSGTRYYYSDCSGLNRIKPENRISFASVAMAEKAGYTKAANCH